MALVHGNEYANSGYLLVVLAVGAVFQYSGVFLGSGLNAMRNFHYQFYIQIIGLVQLTLLVMILIQPYGVIGVAYALLIGSIKDVVLSLISVLYLMKKALPNPDGASR